MLVPVPALAAQKLKEIGCFKIQDDLRLNWVALSPNGKIIALGAGDSRGGLLKLWEVTTGKETVSQKLERSIDILTFSRDGKRLASADGHNQITIWDVVRGRELTSFTGHTESITNLSFSSDGKRLASVGWREVNLWDVLKGKEIASFKRIVSGFRTAFTPDLKLVASPNFQETDLWDVARGKIKAILSEHRGQVGSLVLGADGKTLVAASSCHRRRWRYIGQIKTWDLASGKERTTIKGRFGDVLSLALSPDGKTLAFLHLEDLEGDVELRVINIATSRVLFNHKGKERSLHSLEYRPDGTLFVFEMLDKKIKLWKLSPLKK
jgi:WD40 repeat protein